MIGGLLVDLISWRAAVAIGMLIALPVAAFIWYDLPSAGPGPPLGLCRSRLGSC